MEVLYVIGSDASITDNEPLRYSLRSLAKFAKGVDKIYVVGYPPSWLAKNVSTLEVHDEFGGKHWNILNCIRRAVQSFGLRHDFLYSSDDHFLLKPVDLDSFPYFAKGKLYSYYEYLSSKGKDPGKYQKSIIATRRLLEERGLDTTMACCHRNTHIDGNYVDAAWDLALQFSEYTQFGFEPSCIINSIRQKVSPISYTMITQSQDSKVKTVDDIIEKSNKGDTYFSTTPSAELNRRVISWMQNHYPTKCKWER